jgi:hypothetical protein
MHTIDCRCRIQKNNRIYVANIKILYVYPFMMFIRHLCLASSQFRKWLFFFFFVFVFILFYICSRQNLCDAVLCNIKVWKAVKKNYSYFLFHSFCLGLFFAFVRLHFPNVVGSRDQVGSRITSGCVSLIFTFNAILHFMAPAKIERQNWGGIFLDQLPWPWNAAHSVPVMPHLMNDYPCITQSFRRK